MLKLVILGIVLAVAYRMYFASKNKSLPPDLSDTEEDLYVDYEEVDEE
jgi:hypothetical protein